MVFTLLLMSLSTGVFLVDDMHLPSRATHICARHLAVFVCTSLLGVVPAAAPLPLDSVGDKMVRTGFYLYLLLS